MLGFDVFDNISINPLQCKFCNIITTDVYIQYTKCKIYSLLQYKIFSDH